MKNSSFSSHFQLSGVYAPLDNSGVVKIPQNPTVNQFNTYCSNMLEYMSTCIQGPDVITYCNTPGLYCIDNHSPYLLNDVEVQCNATIIDLCPERHYCPDARTMIECPRGHFCREGKSEYFCRQVLECPLDPHRNSSRKNLHYTIPNDSFI